MEPLGIAYHPYRNKVNLKEKNPLLSLPTKVNCIYYWKEHLNRFQFHIQ
jgi:hypothetical protein